MTGARREIKKDNQQKIMKIGIITQPFHTNYGGILQNYALQQVLKQSGHEVWTIDYSNFSWFNWFDNAWRVIVLKLFGYKTNFMDTPNERKRKNMPLRRFVRAHIDVTQPCTKKFKRSIVKKYSLDALVVGSDQVWRPRYNDRIEDCFLKFASNLNIKRVAYAASFGTDDWEFTNEQTERCAELAKKFDGISVREKSGVTLCEKYLKVSAIQVLDPTLLLHAEDYIKLCSHIPKRKPFVFAYILDGSEDKNTVVNALSERIGLPCIIKGAGNAISADDTIELWISYFRDAAFVITDSFHGMAFSIIFNNEFLVFGNENRGNSRFDSLLDLLDLKNRIIKNMPSEHLGNINWDSVNVRRENAIKSSKLWLMQNL